MRVWRNRQTRTFKGRVRKSKGSSPFTRTKLLINKGFDVSCPLFFYTLFAFYTLKFTLKNARKIAKSLHKSTFFFYHKLQRFAIVKRKGYANRISFFCATFATNATTYFAKKDAKSIKIC